MIALSKGFSAAPIAEILLLDEKTSHHYFDRYQPGGIEALLDDNHSGAESKLDEHQLSELEEYILITVEISRFAQLQTHGHKKLRPCQENSTRMDIHRGFRE